MLLAALVRSSSETKDGEKCPPRVIDHNSIVVVLADNSVGALFGLVDIVWPSSSKDLAGNMYVV